MYPEPKIVRWSEVVFLTWRTVYSKPVYGVIFLFRWHEDNPSNQEASCPDGLWFANQTADNACASVALLNIVNNIDDITLGDTLAGFKEFTMPFTPALRGDAIANFEFVKGIHNSFARNMDILNSDLNLKNEATASSRSKRQRDPSNADEAAFHFIAFVPALGRVWKFDGLERQPQDLAACSDGDWLEQVRSHLIGKMTEYEEDQIEFSVLSLVRDPLRDHVEHLARNVKELQRIRDRLTASQLDDLRAMLGTGVYENVLLGASPALGLTEESMHLVPALDDEGLTIDELPQEYVRLANDQRDVTRSIMEEMQLRQADDMFAEGKRHDYSAAMEFWARALARKGVLEEFLT